MMKIYTINIVTVTKNSDLYELVAVNEYPILVYCEDRERLEEILAGPDFVNRIKDELKTVNLYNKGIYYIREIDGEDFTINVPEVTKVEFSKE